MGERLLVTAGDSQAAFEAITHNDDDDCVLVYLFEDQIRKCYRDAMENLSNLCDVMRVDGVERKRVKEALLGSRNYSDFCASLPKMTRKNVSLDAQLASVLKVLEKSRGQRIIVGDGLEDKDFGSGIMNIKDGSLVPVGDDKSIFLVSGSKLRACKAVYGVDHVIVSGAPPKNELDNFCRHLSRDLSFGKKEKFTNQPELITRKDVLAQGGVIVRHL